jgi:hypothetical protein
MRGALSGKMIPKALLAAENAVRTPLHEDMRSLLGILGHLTGCRRSLRDAVPNLIIR